MKKTIALLIMIPLAFNACLSDPELETEPDLEPEIEDTEEVTQSFDYNAVLEDVTGGNASGTAGASYEENLYTMYAEFENLPLLEEGYFYEGWVVRNSPLSVISTGPTEMDGDMHVNNFTSEEDLTDHTFYVLTLEPDDGDPAPADHTLEGTMN